MKYSVLILAMAFSASAYANVFCKSKSKNTTVELLASESELGKYEMKVFEKTSVVGIISKSRTSLSHPMSCEIQSNGAVCTVAILKIQFERNENGLYSIHEHLDLSSMPNMRNFKDPSAKSYGNDFTCSFGV